MEDRVLLAFDFGINYHTGPNPRTIIVGDFNSDGHDDLAVVNDRYSSITVLLGTGTGAFQQPRIIPIPHLVIALATGDFNGDGIPDLVTANFEFQGTVSVLLGNGDGSFRSPVDYPVGDKPDSVAVGDFDGDGNLDLAVTNQASHSLDILRGDGTGSFRLQGQYQIGMTPEQVAAGDLNGDGIPDLVTANFGSQTVSVLLGNGDGSFRPAVDYQPGGYAGSITLADLNNDGRLDLAVQVNSIRVAVLLGNGDGTFQPPVFSDTGPYANYAAVADFNGDGILDLAVANSYQGGHVSVLLGNGDGSFQPPITYLTSAQGQAAVDLVAGDFDEDQAPDLAVIRVGPSTGTAYVTALLNRPTIPIRLRLDLPSDHPADMAFPVTVSAEDIASGVPVGYAGPVRFSSSDPAALLPASSQFVAQPDGSMRFTATLRTPGSQSLTVADVDVPALASQATVAVGPPVHFGRFATYGRPGGLVAMAEGDVNGDGIPDLVVVEPGTSPDYVPAVDVLLGNGDGSFQEGYNVLNTRVYIAAVALGDVNGDGVPDLVLGSDDLHQPGVFVLLGNGDGSFQSPLYHETNPLGVLILGDFNGDGRLDIATSTSVLLGNGDGTFGPAIYHNSSSGVALAAADFNGDGRLDVALVWGTQVAVLLGNGDGTFGPPSNYPTGRGSVSVAAADLDGDGIPDLVTANYEDNTVSVLLGNGDGTFRPHQDFAAGLGPVTVTVADVNGDGVPDLVTADGLGNSASVLVGNGDGSFQEPFSFGAALRPVAVVAGDFTADGYPDLAVAGSAGDIAVLVNLADWAGPRPPRSDSVSPRRPRLLHMEGVPVVGNRMGTFLVGALSGSRPDLGGAVWTVGTWEGDGHGPDKPPRRPNRAKHPDQIRLPFDPVGWAFPLISAVTEARVPWQATER